MPNGAKYVVYRKSQSNLEPLFLSTNVFKFFGRLQHGKFFKSTPLKLTRFKLIKWLKLSLKFVPVKSRISTHLGIFTSENKRLPKVA